MKISCESVESGRARPVSRRTPLLLFLVLPLALSGQAGAPGGNSLFSADTNLVVLHATVRNHVGAFVSDLGRDDFHVYEDGHPQTIRVFRHEDVPVSLGLLVDNSTSMRNKQADVAAAALAFARSSNPQDEIFIVNFNQRVTLGLPSEKLFSANPKELEAAITRAPAYGMTALYDAIAEGLDHLKSATTGKKVLIVISDGGDNASRHTLQQVLDSAGRSDVIIYTIGIFDLTDGDQKPGVLRKLARSTGGIAFFPSESREVVPICERIATDIRNQYTIGFTSTNPKLDNTYRTIRVTASGPHRGKLSVRTREGYIASPQRIASDSSGSPQ